MSTGFLHKHQIALTQLSNSSYPRPRNSRYLLLNKHLTKPIYKTLGTIPNTLLWESIQGTWSLEGQLKRRLHRWIDWNVIMFFYWQVGLKMWVARRGRRRLLIRGLYSDWEDWYDSAHVYGIEFVDSGWDVVVSAKTVLSNVLLLQDEVL